ncbi:uncharacterized protein CLUP02_02186 [Colletotrichum lupini]|uniref:Uncharacterized protein n=1 Tax=Colletotrichum lupini TaxID=145971 RepID=A0A9Q8WAE5_9PEZI|nr:uncharacterized protein CLUP02_02186 [Colletotrichum lupini]UQC75532.1 hypothetical protein CLUP02_02186 [Colletotrichum lupini]
MYLPSLSRHFLTPPPPTHHTTVTHTHTHTHTHPLLLRPLFLLFLSPKSQQQIIPGSFDRIQNFERLTIFSLSLHAPAQLLSFHSIPPTPQSILLLQPRRFFLPSHTALLDSTRLRFDLRFLTFT